MHFVRLEAHLLCSSRRSTSGVLLFIVRLNGRVDCGLERRDMTFGRGDEKRGDCAEVSRVGRRGNTEHVSSQVGCSHYKLHVQRV